MDVEKRLSKILTKELTIEEKKKYYYFLYENETDESKKKEFLSVIELLNVCKDDE